MNQQQYNINNNGNTIGNHYPNNNSSNPSGQYTPTIVEHGKKNTKVVQMKQELQGLEAEINKMSMEVQNDSLSANNKKAKRNTSINNNNNSNLRNSSSLRNQKENLVNKDQQQPPKQVNYSDSVNKGDKQNYKP